jgi:hypothetical protein
MVTGRSLSGEHDATVHERMSELERAAGGKGAAARMAGVSERSWRDWRRGTHNPSRLSAERLRGAVRRARLSPGRETKLRDFRGAVTITGKFRVSKDVRMRKVKMTRNNLPKHAHDIPGRIVDDVLSGDDQTAGDRLLGLVGAYAPGMEVQDIRRSTFS